jgi:hypothetical protein
MTAGSLNDLADRLNDPELGRTVLPDGTSVILDISGHQVLSLSKTGTFVVQEIRNGATSIDELAGRLAARYEVDATTARSDSERFVEDLSKALL